MKQLLLLPALFLSLHAAAQDTTTHCSDRCGAKRITLGVSFSPDYSFRTLSYDGSNPTIQAIVNDREKNEISGLRYTAGLHVSYALNRHLSITSGLQYAVRGYNSEYRELQFSPPDPRLPVRYRNNYRFSYLDIPLGANLTLGKRRLRFSAGAGIAINLLVREEVTTFFEYGDGSRKREQRPYHAEFRQAGISPMVSAGIDYRFGKYTFLKVAPIFRYSLTPLADAPIKEHLWSAGLHIGCYRTL